MATYSFKTWERLDIDMGLFWGYGEDVNFIILDRQVTSGMTPPEMVSSIVYSGFCPVDGFDGYGGLWVDNVNQVLSPLLSIGYGVSTTAPMFGNLVRKKFWIYVTDDNWRENWDGTDIDMEYDWSYDPSRIYSPVLSDPIEMYVDPRQYLVWTVQQTVPGTYNRSELIVNGSVAYWIGLNQQNYAYTFNSNVGQYIGTNDGDQGSIGSDTFTVRNTCCDYCLYYPNSIGGWNWLLVKGRTIKSNNYTRLGYKQNYFPQTSAQPDHNWCKKNYATQINEKWELNTSWLNDIQSNKMKELFSANNIQLHDLNTGELVNVNITNSSIQEKTYLNQGRKLYAYSIEVEASKPKYRY